jgi:hypothetical protein
LIWQHSLPVMALIATTEAGRRRRREDIPWGIRGRRSRSAKRLRYMASRLQHSPLDEGLVTDKDGNFEIKNVPPGEYRIVYWLAGERKDQSRRSVTVKAAGIDIGKIKAEAD